MAAVDELSQLKRLILGQEQQSLERLQQRVERPATRAQDVAEVLVESFELNNNNTTALADAMRAPVRRCISDSVRDDPEEFADALFPVIGPAIRKAVRDSISALSEKINSALERSFSVQGLKWRVESIRSGVPIAELILRDTFIYRVDQAFVVQRDSGLLIAHVEREGAVVQDSDAVSAMLTAIQDFVRDSFSSADGADLDTVRLGGEVVWLFHGPHAITAAIIHGQPPRELRRVFEQVTENIHRLHGEALEKFDGSLDVDNRLSGLSALLQPLLGAESHQKTASAGDLVRKRRLYFALGTVLLIFVSGLAYTIHERNKFDELFEKMAATPGIEIISSTNSKPYAIRAFRDPLAPTLGEMLRELRLTEDELTIEFVPFQSLAPEIVVRRLRSLFDVPPNVVFELAERKLLVSGDVPTSLRTRLAGFPLAIFGIEEVDFSAFVPSDSEIIDQLRQELEAPEQATFRLLGDTAMVGGRVPFSWAQGLVKREIKTPGVRNFDVSALRIEPQELITHLRQLSEAPELVEFSLNGRILGVSGNYTERWRRDLAALVSGSPFVDSLDSSRFVPTEREELRVLAEHINTQKFYFIRNDQFDAESAARASRLAADITRLATLDRLLEDFDLKFEIRAFADTSGTPEQHAAVRRLRAEVLMQYLIANGIREDAISVMLDQPEPATDESLRWRRAEIKTLIGSAKQDAGRS